MGLSGYKVGHVMLYIGGDKFIEAVGGEIQKVVRSTGQERFGTNITELKNGSVTNCGKIYLGTFFE